jgi:hypothetical protein
MTLTKEMINSFPTITEEEEKNEFWDPDEFIRIGMAEFDKAIAEIDRQLSESQSQAPQL